MYSIFEVERDFNLTVDNIRHLFGSEPNDLVWMIREDLNVAGNSLDTTVQINTLRGLKWIRLMGFPQYKDGHITGSVGICHDITSYKQAEEKIIINEKKYRSLFEQASDAIMITDMKGNFLDVNSSMCTTLGFQKEELLRLNVANLIDSEQLIANPIKFQELNEGKHVVNERLMLHKNGNQVPVEVNVKKFGENALLAIARNISERKETARKLKKYIHELALLNTINTVSAKANDVNALLKSLCEVLLSQGEYKLAWIGKANFSDGGNTVRPFISMGDTTDYLKDLVIDLRNENHRKGPTVQALITGETKIINRIQNDSSYEVWRASASKHGFQSSLALCINVEPIDRYVLNVYSSRPDSFEPNEISIMERIAENVATAIKSIHASKDRDTANYQLRERIKELTTVKKVSQLLNHEDEILDDVLLKIVQLLPPGWQYPEITSARIVVGGIEFKTSNYVSPLHRQYAEFILPQGMKGMIEVGYTEDRPLEVEGPFLAEERNLIDMLAEMLLTFFAKRHESMALKSSEANLSSTINNTDTLIWSVDRNLNLTTFNKAFYNYVKLRYGREVKVGSPIFSENEINEMEVLAKKWNRFYKRALAGEKIALEENRFGTDFQYSIGPIVEDDKRVTGVNVFATDVTVQKQRANELMEANKQIGELKLMALRSVMNPHFIFNVLNSIQFYIVANDRLNAVNYLSTFSKLIRSILTHSVHNKIKLEDEIEMLKNYTQLEMVRFENKFSFNMEVDPNLEIDTIEIPSLLVQPFVENAILHGLYNKQGTGLLTIRIKEDDDAVVFEIEDDGVGREAALKHKLNNPSAHKSMGVKLTEERLKLINENHNVSFQVDDLKNGDEPCGTRASIWIRA
jgi:PAS domain S-box-containing protein